MTHEFMEGFFAYEAAWHRLGKVLDNPLTAAEAIIEAGLDWEVRREQVHLQDGTLVPDAFVTVADINGQGRLLGTVGSRYHVVQNRELFTFFDPVVHREEAVYHTGGALRDYRVVWLLAKIPRDYYVLRDDKIETYILLASSHDGSLHITARPTSVRVVCMNTLNAALEGPGHVVRIKHTASARYHLKQAHRVLGLATRYFESVKEAFEAMAGFYVKAGDVNALIKGIFPSSQEEKTGVPHPIVERAREQVLMLFEAGETCNLPGMEGTAWGLYNAVTGYLDHAPERQGVDHLNNIWFGNRADLKQDAFSRILEMVEVR